MFVVLLSVFHIAVAVLIWYGTSRLFGLLEGRGNSPDIAFAAALVPAAVYFLLALTLRSAWWLALAAALATTTFLALISTVTAPFLAFLRRNWPSGINRAKHRGEIGDVLRAYAGAGKLEEALDFIDGSIDFAPYRELKVQLLWATSELFALRSGVPLARKGGVPEPIVERINESTGLVSEVIWGAVESTVSAAALGVHTPALQETVNREAANLRRLNEAMQATRESLAQMALSGKGADVDLEAAESCLRAVAEAARSLSVTNWQLS